MGGGPQGTLADQRARSAQVDRDPGQDVRGQEPGGDLELHPSLPSGKDGHVGHLERFPHGLSLGQEAHAASQADEILTRVADRFKDGERIELDGVYIQYATWWFSLRKSNTEPLVRLRVEADTEELMNKKKEEILEALTAY